jgi:hypothetical protein
LVKQVRRADFRFRINERFLCVYDFGDAWHPKCESSSACRWTMQPSILIALAAVAERPRKIAAVDIHGAAGTLAN